MDVEGGLIAAALDDGSNFMLALERRVLPEYFQDDQHRNVWEYVLQYFGKYGVTPDVAVVHNAYPSYVLAPLAHPAAYYIDTMVDRQAKATLYTGLQDAAGLFDEEGPGVTGAMRAALLKALEQSALESQSAQRLNVAEAMRRQVKLWRTGGPGLGISFGFPTLDHHTSGMRPEQFIVFTGLAKAKKSWTLLHVASTVHVSDYPIAFLTFEMSTLEQMERLATLWGKIPQYVMQQKGQITSIHARDLRRALNIRDQMRPFYSVEDTLGTSTVSSLAAFVKESGVVAVFLDGIYLMTDERSGQAGFEGPGPLTSISRDLKRLAKTLKVTVVATTQTLPSKTQKGRTHLFGMGYTSAFSQDADLIVGIESDDVPSLSIMRILGNRHGMQNIEFQVEWDLDIGLVEELGQSFTTNTPTGASYGNTNAGSTPVPGGAGTPTGQRDQEWGGDPGALPSASLSPGP